MHSNYHNRCSPLWKEPAAKLLRWRSSSCSARASLRTAIADAAAAQGMSHAWSCRRLARAIRSRCVVRPVLAHIAVHRAQAVQVQLAFEGRLGRRRTHYGLEMRMWIERCVVRGRRSCKECRRPCNSRKCTGGQVVGMVMEKGGRVLRRWAS